jgi:hypothetical protein
MRRDSGRMQFHCDHEHARMPSGPEFWFIDVIKLVENNLDESKHLMIAGPSRAECLEHSPLAIKQFVEWGMEPTAACEFVHEAIQHCKEPKAAVAPANSAS